MHCLWCKRREHYVGIQDAAYHHTCDIARGGELLTFAEHRAVFWLQKKQTWYTLEMVLLHILAGQCPDKWLYRLLVCLEEHAKSSYMFSMWVVHGNQADACHDVCVLTSDVARLFQAFYHSSNSFIIEASESVPHCVYVNLHGGERSRPDKYLSWWWTWCMHNERSLCT